MYIQVALRTATPVEPSAPLPAFIVFAIDRWLARALVVVLLAGLR